jgi:hypothetical protein
MGSAMVKLESGPAWGDRLYYGVICIVIIGLGLWFIRDHYYGYPNKNRSEAAKIMKRELGIEQDPQQLRTDLTKHDFEAFQDARKASVEPTTITQLHEALGEPIHIKQEAAAGSSTHYFASLYGLATVPIRDGRVDVEAMGWQKWSKTKSEIDQQFYFAFIPFAVALLFGYYFIRAATLRASMDEEGLTYGGVRIPFAQMKSLRDYNPKGWIDLYYSPDGGSERKLRIDNQKIAKFSEIIDGICAAKGFENELAEHEAQQAAEDPDDESSAEDQSPEDDRASN